MYRDGLCHFGFKRRHETQDILLRCESRFVRRILFSTEWWRDTGFRRCQISAWTWSREYFGWFLSTTGATVLQGTRQADVRKCGQDGYGGGGRRAGRQIGERICKKASSCRYKKNGRRVDSSVWFRCSQKTKGEAKTSRYFLVMAFVHEQSCECTKSELDLFSVPPTQTSMRRHRRSTRHAYVCRVLRRRAAPIEF